jgi:hypothetical protein
MANGKRVAFMTVPDWKPGQRAFEEETIDFEWFLGMSPKQTQKSSLSMLAKLKEKGKKPMEVSRSSEDAEFGVQLSAFNLTLKGHKVENIFQAYKVMTDGGPYFDLLRVEPKFAKNDCRIQIHNTKTRKPCQTNKVKYTKDFYEEEAICKYCKTRKERQLKSFGSKVEWPLEPKSMFYDAVYIMGLIENKELSDKLIDYDAFTDIQFNQKDEYATKKGPFNCQARSCAIFSTLKLHKYTDAQILEIVSTPEKMKHLYEPVQQVVADEPKVEQRELPFP